MHLYKAKSFNGHLHYILWEIHETEDELRKDITLHPSDRLRMEKLTHPEKIREFLALRCCLKYYFGENPEVFYTAEGKPYLENGPPISFTHTAGFAGLVVGKKLPVGLDLEVHRDSIERIAPKFLRDDEKTTIDHNNRTAHITYYWGAKEVLVKIEGNRRLHFRKQLRISPFIYRDYAHTTAVFSGESSRAKYQLYFEKHQNLYLTYGWKVN